jgi:hypothetical protein
MRSAIIQLFLALCGIGFAIAGSSSVGAPYIVGAFVIWALRRDEE